MKMVHGVINRFHRNASYESRQCQDPRASKRYTGRFADGRFFTNVFGVSRIKLRSQAFRLSRLMRFEEGMDLAHG
jgi:hypothetical protein